MKVCSIEDCEKEAHAKTWCHGHWTRWRRHGDPTKVVRRFSKGLTCEIEECDKPVKSRYMCSLHYWRWYRHGDPHHTRTVSLKPYMRSGYEMVYDPSHPNAGSGGSVGVHTVVMAEMLGRPLRKGESVHHKNSIRNDNRPDNLELWVKSQPAGARVIDLIEHATWVLTYAPDMEALGWKPRNESRNQFERRDNGNQA